jgi:TolB-like protein
VRSTFRVGPWVVEPGLNVISRNGTTTHLEPKVMEVLACLAEHPGETLSKETLLQAAWPDAFVSDSALTHCMSELRRVFDDDPRDPHVIQTVAKRGYRLIASINRSLVDAPTVGASGPTTHSIAVLPFVNMSADAENEFFVDGITEEIINVLSHVEGLRVAARTSCFFFKGKHADMREIGDQLNARVVLEGSVRKAGDHLRITAQLVNVADGYHLWSERYDRELKDIFAIQDEIAPAIAVRLKLTLEGEVAERVVSAATSNLDAYELYLKGRALLYRRGRATRQAAECFERAVELDPNYALAWAGVADAYTTIGYYGFARPEASMPKGMSAARRAVALGPSFAEAHNALAMASLMGTWDKAEAETEFLVALQLNPHYIQARAWYALFYLQFSQGRLADGVAQAKLLLETDPLSSYAHSVYSLTSAVAGQHADAIQASRRAVELDPESYLAHMIFHGVLHISGEFEEAVRVGELALAMSGRHFWSMAVQATTFADWNRPGLADAVYQEMLARSRTQYVSPALLAVAASAAGREKDALVHAGEGLELRDPACEVYFSRYFIYSARLYAYPRFRELLSDLAF